VLWGIGAVRVCGATRVALRTGFRGIWLVALVVFVITTVRATTRWWVCYPAIIAAGEKWYSSGDPDVLGHAAVVASSRRP